MNRKFTSGFAVGIVAGVLGALVAGPRVLHAEGGPSVAPPPTPGHVASVPGNMQVTRLSDTSFVVVKDLGEEEEVTFFTTDTGLIVKKHSGKFFY